MPTYLSPGVYVEEMRTGARPIQPVGTSTAGFVGVAPIADAHPLEPVAVDNWTRFVKEFAEGAEAATPLAQAVFGFFQNGGSRCWIVNLGAHGQLEAGLRAFEAIDEIAILCAPGLADPAAWDALLSHCELMKDRFAVLDAPEQAEIEQLTRVAVVAAPGTPAEPGKPGLRPRVSDGGYGAVYWPWIVTKDALHPEHGPVTVPPSGHIAGIYARSDATRGVHKAPANEVVRGALNVAHRLSAQEQGVLNPAGVNCIRYFSGQGIRVWGARTVAEGSSEWRYVNLRRVFNFVEESIARSTNWIVFEPNDQRLWQAIVRDISSFLTQLWREGMLMGATAEEAFFVKCDGESNTAESIELGQVVTVIGLAVVKPAEFIVFRIGQYAGGATIEEG